MRGGVIHHSPHGRSPKPLVVRAGLGHTFGSLAGFLAMIFLCWGTYILEDAFAHPVDAQAAALIAAAFAITLAALLLFYILKPRRIAGIARHPSRQDSAARAAEPASRAPSASARREDLRKDLAYQRIYVDHSRIRP